MAKEMLEKENERLDKELAQILLKFDLADLEKAITNIKKEIKELEDLKSQYSFKD
tara:strand:- start:233 stop:397 length:165 start_codon:yes stop_codon:yes gene_type:complete